MLFSHLVQKTKGPKVDWSFASLKPQHMSGNLGQALSLINDNKRSVVDADHPTLYFIDDDMIRAP